MADLSPAAQAVLDAVIAVCPAPAEFHALPLPTENAA